MTQFEQTPFSSAILSRVGSSLPSLAAKGANSSCLDASVSGENKFIYHHRRYKNETRPGSSNSVWSTPKAGTGSDSSAHNMGGGESGQNRRKREEGGGEKSNDVSWIQFAN